MMLGTVAADDFITWLYEEHGKEVNESAMRVRRGGGLCEDAHATHEFSKGA